MKSITKAEYCPSGWPQILYNRYPVDKGLKVLKLKPRLFVFGVAALSGPVRLSRFLDHTQRRTTVGRTPLDEWSARLRDLYLITHNTNREASMPPEVLEPTISAGERPPTYALDRAATVAGQYWFRHSKFNHTYVLTPWCRVLLEKLTGLQLV